MTEPKSTSNTEKTYYCSNCKKPLRRIEGKMGPFWGCSGFPLCKTTLNDVAGKPSQEIDEHYRCPVCTRRLVRADKEKGDYWFCSGYSKGCKVTLADQGGIPETAFRCRECGHLLVKRKGKKGEFWGCSEFPKCTASYPDKDHRPNFDILTFKHS